MLEDAFAGQLASGTGSPRARSDTGWLTEGIPDYIRWFLFEPNSHGADFIYFKELSESAAKKGQTYELKYDGKYRPTGYFLNFITQKYDPQIVSKVSDSLRQGRYYEAIWFDNTGKTLQELNQEWLDAFQKELKAGAAVSASSRPKANRAAPKNIKCKI